MVVIGHEDSSQLGAKNFVPVSKREKRVCTKLASRTEDRGDSVGGGKLP
jgi:hypothetical protein